MRTILLTYGDRRQLRAGLAQATGFGHPVTLLAGRPSATRGLGTHRSRVVDVAEETGRQGLLATLEDLDDTTPVLVIHDDVLLHEEGAARLLGAVTRGRIVAPASNQADADGYVGALPDDRPQPVRDGEVAVGEAFRTSCFATSAGRLRALALHSVTSASRRIHLPDGTVVIDHAVLATHLDSCRDQLEDPVGPDGRPLLVASMIVRDEEDFLGDCLASLDGLVDRIDICDTGSTDRTVEIAREHGAQVIEREWRDDFGWARNEALSLSRDAWWVLQIDADERAVVEDREGFRARLATMLSDREGLNVPLSDLDDEGERVRTHQLPRLFPGEGTEFIGRLHEVAHHPTGRPYVWSMTTELELLHLGYQASVWTGRDKHDRNLQLAREMHAERDSLASAYQLARSLPRTRDGHQEIVELLEHRLTETTGTVVTEGKSAFNADATARAHAMLATSLHELGRTEDAWETAIAARERFPASIPLRQAVSKIGLVLGRFDEVIESSSMPVTMHGRTDRDSRSESWTNLDLVEAHLATGALDQARTVIERMLEDGLPRDFPRWRELVSATALAYQDDAVEALLRASLDDRSGNALYQSGLLMDPADGAEFAAECAVRSELSDEQASAAMELLLREDTPEHLRTLLDNLPHTPRSWSPRQLLDRAGERSADVLAAHFGIEHVPEERLVEIVSQLAPGEDVPTAVIDAVAEDESGQVLQSIARAAPIEIAAAVARAALGEDPPSGLLSVALATCCLSGDEALLTALRPHLDRFDVPQVDRSLTVAARKGHGAVAAGLAHALLSQHLGQSA